jgi:hypothetical protein
MPAQMQLALQMLAITLGAQIIILLLIRPIILWYFKINESVRLQKATLFMLRKTYEQNGGKFDDVVEKDLNKLIRRDSEYPDPLSMNLDSNLTTQSTTWF